MEDKRHIEVIIKNTYEVIKQVYTKQQERNGNKHKENAGSRIIFPSYNDDKKRTRVSEQELRFIFVEQFNLYCQKEGWDAFYSVETPTKLKKYRFEKGKDPKLRDDGRSASHDLVIHNKEFKRIALIEFKANNPNERAYRKDLFKLEKEPEKMSNHILCYFLQIVETSYEKTKKSIKKKCEGWKDEKTIQLCYDLSKGKYIINDLNL